MPVTTTKKRNKRDKTKPSVRNIAINEFFFGMQKNGRGEEWFSPVDNPLLPQAIKEMYNSLRVFFRKKKWHNGGAIPDELLFTKRNFRLVNNIALIDAVELAYDCINQSKQLAKTEYKKNIEIAITLKVMHECERKDIPQDHIGGLLLLYLELCERVVLL